MLSIMFFIFLSIIFFLSFIVTGSPEQNSYGSVKEVTAGGRHTCAILNDGKLKCWGWNGHGQLGLGDLVNRGGGDNDMGENLPPVDLGNIDTVKQISVGSSHTCAILGNDLLKCWGWNKYGQLGLRNLDRNRGDANKDMGEALPPFNYSKDILVDDVSAGHSQTCSIFRKDQRLCCWGRRWNAEQQPFRRYLKNDSPVDENNIIFPNINATASQVVVGDSHNCVILDDDTLKCWGWNRYGQLGLGDILYRGATDDEMGENLPAIDLGSSDVAIGKLDYVAKQVSAGYAHTCVVFVDNSLKCWGFNYDGQLGLGDRINRGDLPSQMGSNLPTVNVGSKEKVKQVSVGYYHTCALLTNDAIKCWGANNYGQLGQGDMIARGTSPDEMGDNLPEVDLGGYGAKQVSAGFGHTCAVLDNDSVKCWGLNDRGQLGVGDNKDRGDLSKSMGENLPFVELNSVSEASFPTASPTTSTQKTKSTSKAASTSKATSTSTSSASYMPLLCGRTIFYTTVLSLSFMFYI